MAEARKKGQELTSRLRSAAMSAAAILLLLVAESGRSEARQINVQTKYSFPGSYNISPSIQPSSYVGVGLYLTHRPGPFDEVEEDEASDVGFNLAGFTLDLYPTGKAQSFDDSFLISSWVAHGISGSEKGRQRSLSVAVIPSYLWIWRNGINISTGLGIHYLAWSKPYIPSKFGSALPIAEAALGIAF